MGVPGLRLLFIDTIGFMADLPQDLIAAFRATLMECLDAEFILHVIDVSQPGWQIFSSYIDQVLRDAGVHYATDDQVPRPISQCDEPGPRPCQPVLLRVGNKCDLGINLGVESPDFPLLPPVKLDAQVSCTTGSGLHHLCRLLESNLISIFGWRRKLVRMRQGSHALYWLYENSMVMSIAATADDPEKLECEVLFNRISWRLFQSKFFSRPSQTL
uniref:GTP-binding protein 6 n=2 Tax=Schistocephalus solidus TaxID=70667 RepID=A0A0V0JA22_SCHSO